MLCNKEEEQYFSMLIKKLLCFGMQEKTIAKACRVPQGVVNKLKNGRVQTLKFSTAMRLEGLYYTVFDEGMIK